MPQKSFNMVAEDTNKREGSMSDPAEIEQAILDIVTFQYKKADKKIKKIRGAASEEVQPIQKIWDEIPLAFASLLKKHNGGIIFYEYVMLSSKEILKAYKELGGHEAWRKGFLPFASDVDGNMLIINTPKQTVHEWDEELGLGDRVGESFADFLEVYRNELIGSKLEFIEVSTDSYN
eukprot:INCI488.2.p1 GENE.INCI488.2~~INCI488.2.p1  ORF type:complete len:177 (-),score=35.34 INCI488.2:40-570(-)